MRIFKLTMLSFSIIVSSFFLTLYALEDSWKQGNVYLNFTATKFSNTAIYFDKNWEHTEDDIFWTKERNSNFSVKLDHRPRGELLMLIKARSKPLIDKSVIQLEVHVNDNLMGRYDLSAKEQGSTYPFFISQDVASKSKTMNVVFKLIPVNHKILPSLGIEQFILQDHLAEKNEMTGNVDACTPQTIQGWAVSGNTGSHVLIRLNGAIVGKTNNFYDRPDLEQHGWARKSGFSFHFPRAPEIGDKVEVIFPNGLPVPGSKCKF